MDYFVRKKGQLYCESVPLAVLAERYGTPLYVYSLRTFVRHFQVASRAFGSIRHGVFYSAKANSNIALLRVVAELGGGCDVVSLGEYLAARKAGIKRLIFSGVGKTMGEIETALRGGLDFFGVESESELEVIEKTARKLQMVAPISLRVNPDVDPRTHPNISTGLRRNKFGIPAVRALRLYREIARSEQLEAVAISMHLGSQIESVEPFVEGLIRLKEIYQGLLEQRITLKHIDLGGGWAVPFTRQQEYPRPDEYVRAMAAEMKGLDVEFIVEPGRALVGNAGVLVTRVIYIKRGYARWFVVVDAGMNDFLRPVLYRTPHRIEPITLKRGKASRSDIVGPICESTDTFVRNINLEGIAEGDLLCLFTAGAYGFTMASNYNSRLRPAEVLVDGTKSYLIREREGYNDLWRRQKPAQGWLTQKSAR